MYPNKNMPFLYINSPNNRQRCDAVVKKSKKVIQWILKFSHQQATTKKRKDYESSWKAKKSAHYLASTSFNGRCYQTI
jgi:hypothetical protein